MATTYKSIFSTYSSKLKEDFYYAKQRNQLILWIADHYLKWLKEERGVIFFYRKTDLPKQRYAPIVCSGSVQLGTQHNGSDTDLIFFAPRGITRNAFLHSFGYFLNRKKYRGLSAENLEIRNNAFVPLFRIKINAQVVDCLFVSLPQKFFNGIVNADTPQKYLKELYSNPKEREEFLDALDEKSYLTINSLFTSFAIQSEMIHVLPAWRQFVRLLTFWARQRGLCSHITGFPSPIAFVILATKIMQNHPRSTNPLFLLKRFFETYTQWNWETQDVTIMEQKGKKEEKVRDPMVVWLPCVQSTSPVRMNTCKNVTYATLRVFENELKYGMQMFQKSPYHDIFRKRIIDDHDYVHVVTIYDENHSQQEDYLKWIFKFLLNKVDPFLEWGEIYEKGNRLCLGMQLKHSAQLENDIIPLVNQWKEKNPYVRCSVQTIS